MTKKTPDERQGFMEWLQNTVAEQPEAAAAARDEEARLHLARALRRAREEVGMTQALLAEASGLKQAMISRLEKADHNPTVATVLKYVTALGGELVMGVVVGDVLFGATDASSRTVTLPAYAVSEARRRDLDPKEYVLTCVARDQSSRAMIDVVREEIRVNMVEMRSWMRASGDTDRDGRPTQSYASQVHGKRTYDSVAA